MTTTAVTTKKLPETGILVLGTFQPNNVPLVININDGTRRQPNFKLRESSETEIFGSCTVNWKNQNYIFGGHRKRRQISKIEDCRVKFIKKLNFDLYFGACATVSDKVIYLCFNGKLQVDFKLCRTSKSPIGTFTDITKSSHDHRDAKLVNSQTDSKSTLIYYFQIISYTKSYRYYFC